MTHHCLVVSSVELPVSSPLPTAHAYETAALLNCPLDASPPCWNPHWADTHCTRRFSLWGRGDAGENAPCCCLLRDGPREESGPLDRRDQKRNEAANLAAVELHARG